MLCTDRLLSPRSYCSSSRFITFLILVFNAIYFASLIRTFLLGSATISPHFTSASVIWSRSKLCSRSSTHSRAISRHIYNYIAEGSVDFSSLVTRLRAYLGAESHKCKRPLYMVVMFYNDLKGIQYQDYRGVLRTNYHSGWLLVHSIWAPVN